MPLYNPTDLQTIYGSWNPEAYNVGRQQVQMTQDAELQNQAKTAQEIRAKELSNLFEEKANPLRLEGLGLENTGKDLSNKGVFQDNRKKAVEGNIAEATQQWKINDAQRKELAAIPAHEITMAELHAQKMMMDPDPQVRAQGEQVWNFSKWVREEQFKHKNQMAITESTNKSHEAVAKGNNAATIEAARIAAASREAAAKARGTTALKPPPNAEAAYVRQLKDQLDAGDITQEQYETRLVQYLQAQVDARTLANASGVTAKVNPAGGIDLQNKPGSPQIAPVAGKGQSTSLPPVEIKSVADLQRMYPGRSIEELKAAYKKKYGVDLK